MELEGHSVLIVGGGSGLGQATALLAADRGAARIGLVDLNLPAAEQVAASLRDKGADAVAVKGDIARKEGAEAAFSQVANRFGRIHAVANCAAIYPRRPILEISDDDWDLENAINIKGTYHVMVAAVNHMKRHVAPPKIAGRIVNITSVDAFKAHPQNAHYAATKAAVVSLTRSFAHEFAPDQILINSVAPAGIATDKARSLGILPELAAANPLGRAAEPAEMAEFVVMLMGRRNSYMTGENVIVSGGYIYA